MFAGDLALASGTCEDLCEQHQGDRDRQVAFLLSARELLGQALEKFNKTVDRGHHDTKKMFLTDRIAHLHSKISALDSM